METALKLIISRTNNQHVASEALACLQAIRVKSPIVQIRYQRVVQMALANNDDWTPAERAILAEPLEVPETSGRDFLLRVRLTDLEHAELQRLADEANLGMSEYVRRKLFE
jgi:hypothetical protein